MNADNSRARKRWSVDIAITAIVAALVTVGVWAEVTSWPSPIVFPAGAYLIGLAASALLMIRRTRPVLCTALILVLTLGYHFVGYPGAAPALALFVALFTLAEQATSVWWIVASVIVVLVWEGAQSLPPNAVPGSSYALTGPAVGMLVWIAIGVASRQLRRSNARDVAVARMETEAAANERLAQERLRIAREVHDVLAHTISAVAVQSAAALDAFEAGQPEDARENVERIRALTRQASPEVRRAVEYLRGEDAPSRTPQPGIPDLGDLVSSAVQSGLDARIKTTGDLGSVSPVTGMTAYRIVQEAITNVLKHAGASHVDIAVHIAGEHLVVDVVDDGAEAVRAGAAQPAGGGFGIRGMRERAAAVGGSVTAAPAATGGFAVHAELPLDAGAAGGSA